MSSGKNETAEVRRFGLIALVLFGALCAVAAWRGRAVPTGLFGALAVLGLLFSALPGPMAPVHRGWLAVSQFLGRGMSAVFLTLAFFLVITPSGWLRRLLAGPLLPLRPDREQESYWTPREEPLQPPERFTKRF